jgi:hypothetical protein
MARRLARLETDLRVVDQHLTPCVFSGMRTREGTGGISVGCPQCGGLLQIGEDRLIPQHGCVVGDWAADLAAEQTQLVAQIEDLKARLAGRRTGHGHRGAAAA